MIFLSAAFGATAGVAGSIISVQAARIPTGPMIVLCMTLIVLISIFFAPARGILWEALRLRRARKRNIERRRQAGLRGEPA
jgi:manganese/zinc/iron transport system permease protein